MLERLAQEHRGRVFDPALLTEDYEIGVRVHAAGYPQTFCPLRKTGEDWVATREYFPRTLRAAVRQRTRWVVGIALQTWERHGWRGSWQTKWWFWRDRKALLANPLSAAANLVFLAGVADFPISAALHTPWIFYVQDRRVAALCAATLGLQCLRLGLRAFCVGRIFGWTAALGVPLRSFHANLINCAASMFALATYFGARRNRRTVEWQKTEHDYPDRHALHAQRRALSDVLIGCGLLSEQQMEEARRELARGGELDLLLLAKGVLTEHELCKALSLQSGLPAARVDPEEVNARVLRGLPAHLEKRHRVLPFEVRAGRLLVAAMRAPSPAVCEEIERHSSIPVEVQLVTPTVYNELLRRAVC